MAEHTRTCGACDMQVTASGEGHALDCLRAQPVAPLPREVTELVESLPAAYHQYAQTLDPSEIEGLLANNKKWRADPNTLLDHLLDLNLLSIQILERMITKPGPGRSGPQNQRMAIRELTEISQKVVPMIAAAKAEKARQK